MMNERAITLPFSINSYGQVSSTTEQSKIWADKVRSAVGTTLRERVMRPEFGGNIAFRVFDNQELAVSEIKSDVEQVFNTHLKMLKLNNVTTTFDEFTGTVTANITYSLPNDKVITTNIGLITVLGTNPHIEETL